MNKFAASSPHTNDNPEALPASFYLTQNFPNPFNPETEIQYGLPSKGHVRLRIYDVLGVEVRALVEEVKAGGRHRIIWDGKDRDGNIVASGVYLYRITFTAEENAQALTRSGKMSLLR
ncbi:MAG: FlgD immunoglobulin-like domain containing protein [candidate division KSB1 bacterium]